MHRCPLRKYDIQVDPDTYYVYVAKRRNGPIREDRVELKFNPEKQQIYDTKRFTEFDEWNREATT